MSQFAVIFDMDGVLVDSYHAHFLSSSRLYDELGLPYSEAAFAADFGRTSRDIIRRSFGDSVSDAVARDYDTRKETYFREVLRGAFPVMDGAPELIDALAADGFRLAVGSSGPPENIALCLDKLGRRQKFAAVVTGVDVQRGKPDPQVFQTAAARLSVSPADCAVVEDAVHGIEAANRAGMVSIGITGTVERPQLSAAKRVVESLRELSPKDIRAMIANHTC